MLVLKNAIRAFPEISLPYNDFHTNNLNSFKTKTVSNVTVGFPRHTGMISNRVHAHALIRTEA